MPVFRTRISTSLMPISGSGTSSSHKPGSALALTSARNRSSSSRRPRPQQARRICERLSQAPSPPAATRHDRAMGDNPFSLAGRVAVVTGGTGAIGSALATGLAQAGARVVVLARSADRRRADGARRSRRPATRRSGSRPTSSTRRRSRPPAMRSWRTSAASTCSSTAPAATSRAATVPDDASPFDVPIEAYRDVVDLNLIGTLLPIRVFGPAMRRSPPAARSSTSRRSRPLAL